MHVPANSVSDYQEAEYWQNFYIVPTETSVEYCDLTDRGVRYFDGIIYNENELNLTVYNMNGQAITTGNGDIDIRNCPNGMYVVTDNKGGKTKIMR